MSLELLQLMALGGPMTPVSVSDVFSATTYTGNGSTQTITNGINLSGSGGMVWIKDRGTPGFTDNTVHDSARGATNLLTTASTAGNGDNSGYVSAFNSNGFSAGNHFRNENSHTYVSWTFRKEARFFDVVAYVGNGSNGRSINHSLGVTPGLVIVKSYNANTEWAVWHKSLSTDSILLLSGTGAAIPSQTEYFGTHTSSTFGVDSGTYVNGNSTGYVAFLFADDSSGLIQCGSFTTDGSGNATVNHGWSAGVQFALIKCSSTTGDWEMFDTARTSGWTGSDARLRANLSNAEDSVTRLSASGTSVSFAGLSNSATYIYMLIVSPT